MTKSVLKCGFSPHCNVYKTTTLCRSRLSRPLLVCAAPEMKSGTDWQWNNHFQATNIPSWFNNTHNGRHCLQTRNITLNPLTHWISSKWDWRGAIVYSITRMTKTVTPTAIASGASSTFSGHSSPDTNAAVPTTICQYIVMPSMVTEHEGNKSRWTLAVIWRVGAYHPWFSSLMYWY